MKPKGTLYKRGRSWYLNCRIGGVQIRRSLGVMTEAQAQSALAQFQKENFGKSSLKNPAADRPVTKPWHIENAIVRDWEMALKMGLATHSGWLRVLYQRASDRARFKGIPWQLSLHDLEGIARESAGICAVSGLQFNWLQCAGGGGTPRAPSLDRIKPSLGYSFANVRMVCWAVNRGMSSWGEVAYVEICKAVAARDRARLRLQRDDQGSDGRTSES